MQDLYEKKFTETRVYTKDIITDSFQGIKNIFGLRLREYDLTKKEKKELEKLKGGIE